MNEQMLQVVLTGVVTIAVTVLAGLATTGIALMRKKLGLQETQNDLLTEKNMRDKLQATLVTAVGMYVTGQKKGALDYVIAQAGDAAAHFNLDTQGLNDLIVNKAAAWGAPTAPVKVEN